jgi:ribosomal protein S18 acetylase RimI-like enzyme
MDFQVVTNPDKDILAGAAKLHHGSLSYRSFITLFGEGFLRHIYEAFLEDGLGFIVAATEGNKLVGFVLAGPDSEKMMGALVKRLHIFLPAILKECLKRPAIVKNLFETVFYPSREKTDIRPELFIIAVEESYRSQGVGQRLVEETEKIFVEKGCRKYKVTVHQAMARSIQFYEKNGMHFLKNFMLYGHKWAVYIKEL